MKLRPGLSEMERLVIQQLRDNALTARQLGESIGTDQNYALVYCRRLEARGLVTRDDTTYPAAWLLSKIKK